jgi:hypothetical protein
MSSIKFTYLVPPLSFYYFALIDLINCPKRFVAFVQEDTLEDMIFVRNRGRFPCHDPSGIDAGNSSNQRTSQSSSGPGRTTS